MAASSTSSKRARLANGRGALAWQGFLGNLRRRPALAVGIAALCLVVIGGAGCFMVYPQCWAWYHWWQAQRAAAQYDFPQARSHLQDCTKVWTKSGEVHFFLARACRRDGDYPAARAELQLARRYHWSEEGLELEAKLIQAQSGSVRPVEKFLQACLESGHEDSLLILEALSIGYLQNNYLADAHQWLTTWVKRYPRMWQPHLLLAALYERRHRASLAVDEYEKVLELKPDQGEARYQLATLLVVYAKRYGDALPHFETYVQQRPDDPSGWVGLGRCQRALRQFAAAEASAKHALALHAKDADAPQLLGLLAWDQERLPEALGWLRQAEQLAPHELQTIHALAVVLGELGQEKESARYQGQRLELERELRRLSDILQEIHDLEFRRDSTGGPGNLDRALALRREVAEVHFRIGHQSGALAWLISALQQAPDDLETRRLVAEMQAKVKAREVDVRARPYASPTPQGLGEPYRPRAAGN